MYVPYSVSLGLEVCLVPSLVLPEASRKTISKWSLLRWLKPEIAFGETFWPEAGGPHLCDMLVNPTCLFRSSVQRLDDGHDLQCLQFPRFEVSFPQVFSALTMLFPALHGYYMAPDIAADASFPPGSTWTPMKIQKDILPP